MTKDHHDRPKVQISVGLLLEIGTDLWQLSGRFLSFLIMVFLNQVTNSGKRSGTHLFFTGSLRFFW
jgi:hypothetical protein